VIEFDLIAQQFRDLDWMAFVLAIVVGGAIGLEREFHGRPAGVRTHMMVCLSAAIAIQASQGVLAAMGESEPGRLVFDPNRLAAGIVTGIGFLGAATVIRSGDIVRGITTGACVWAVAVLGIVIGQERYALALAGAAAMLVVLLAFDWIFHWVTPVVYRRLAVSGTGLEMETVATEVRSILSRQGVRTQDLSGEINPGAGTFELAVYVRCRNQLQAPGLLERLGAVEGVRRVQWTQIGS
jgi:putative Mg2+ transporter-C (MgtC) family protein